MVHATLSPMMYDPNVFTLNLEQLLSGLPLDTAIGVIEVTIEAARGLKANKIGGGSPDPYVSVSINNREELARTKYKPSTLVIFIVLLCLASLLPSDITQHGWKQNSFWSTPFKSRWCLISLITTITARTLLLVLPPLSCKSYWKMQLRKG